MDRRQLLKFFGIAPAAALIGKSEAEEKPKIIKEVDLEIKIEYNIISGESGLIYPRCSG